MLTQSELKYHLHYCPETGTFTRLHSIAQCTRVGDIAGGIGTAGINANNKYRRIRVMGDLYTAHHLAYLYMVGEFPVDQIDHINQNKLDNRWCNLRPATHHQNMRNRSKHANNLSGFKGVERVNSRWKGIIHINGVTKHLGTFDTPEEAHAAYIAAKPGFHDS